VVEPEFALRIVGEGIGHIARYRADADGVRYAERSIYCHAGYGTFRLGLDANLG
jgi:hypothetical protein